MSVRSINRSLAREIAREDRRRKRRAALSAAAAIGGGALLAGPAQAATFQVNTTADGPAGACDATCTLRDALDEANDGPVPDTITFAPNVTGLIRLTQGAEIRIEAATTIVGPGSGTLTVSGDADGDGDGDSRIFASDPDDEGVVGDPVTISGLTLANGASAANGGNMISEGADLSLSGMVLAGGIAGSQGGGLYAEGRLAIDSSTFSGNSADNGGGLYADQDTASVLNGDITISNSSFTGNAATDYNGGGAYFDQYSDRILIVGSTFAGNTSADDGAGFNVFGARDGSFTLRNSTVSGNVAGAEGGGIKFGNYFDRPMRIENSTIAGNAATTIGGGIYRYAYDDEATPGSTDDTVVISSSIVADNVAPAGPDIGDRVPGVGDDPVDGTFELGFSLLESTAGAAVTQVPAGSNLLGIDPALAPLADNGGPTQTRLIAPTSAAVDAGTANGLTTDQRGLPRTVDLGKADGSGSDGTDIGSVELADTVLEGATFSAKKKQKQKGKKIKIKVKAGAAEVVDALASGKVKAGKKSYGLKDAKANDVPAGKVARLTLKPKKKNASKKIVKFLQGGRKAKATIDVKVTDAANNSQSKKLKVTLIGKKKKK